MELPALNKETFTFTFTRAKITTLDYLKFSLVYTIDCIIGKKERCIVVFILSSFDNVIGRW